MPKQKVLTPREIYWARKQAQEAYLPPGLINHGNTCFMNSVLQGLIATRLLVDLVQFNDVPEQVQKHSNTLLLSRRSPQLTNGPGYGGLYAKDWVDMPIGDRFLEIIHRAWRIQSERKRENLSPRDLLAAVGQKYDQYLDFSQQDAHEFLRILLDAMRMEEQDIIKQRQPQLPKQPKKRRRSSYLTPSSTTQFPASHATQSTQASAQPLSEANTLISLPDMVFCGRLTSILVCQECKHVSQTYEDFHDISLSLKPEVNHLRRRDRFKKFAKKLTAFPGTSLAAAGSNTTMATSSSTQTSPDDNVVSSSGPKDEDEAINLNEILNSDGGLCGRAGDAFAIQRSSSMPSSPREREDAQISEKLLSDLVSRRRSMEHLLSDLPIPPADGDFSSLMFDLLNGDESTPHAVHNSDNLSAHANEVSDASNLKRLRTSPSETKGAESDDSKATVNSLSISSRVEFAVEEKPIRDHDKEKIPDGKDKKKQEDDSWTKLSRRISSTVRLGLRDKEGNKGKGRKGKGKEEEKIKDAGVSKDKKRSAQHRLSAFPLKSKSSSPVISMSDPLFSFPDDPPNNTNYVPSSLAIATSVSSPGNLSLPSPSITIAPNESSWSRSQPTLTIPTTLQSLSDQSPNTPPLSVPQQSTQSHLQNINMHVQAQIQKNSGMQGSKSPGVPGQTRREQTYLRKILADVAPFPVLLHTMSGSDGEEKGTDGAGAGTDIENGSRTNPLTRLKTSTHSHLPGSNSRSQIQDGYSTSSINANIGKGPLLAATSQFSGLEECLRRFTAVEELNGENMVGCRRCWKIQNGYVKGMKNGEDSGDEDDEEKTPVSEYVMEAKDKFSAPPLQSFDSRSSRSSNATFASVESGGRPDVKETDTSPHPTITASQSQSSIALSVVTSTPVPNSAMLRSDGNIPTDTDTPQAPLMQPAPPPKDKLHTPEVHELSGSTPGGLPIPRISTTLVVDILPNDSISGDNTGDDDREVDDNSSIQTPVSISSQFGVNCDSSMEGSTIEIDYEAKNVQRGQGMSLVVPTRMPGRSCPNRIREMSIESDGSTDTPASRSRSATPSEESDSGEGSAMESTPQTGREVQFISPFAPPGLGYEEYPSLIPSIPPTYDAVAGTAPSTMSPTQPLMPKTSTKVKKKQERILRPAYKRYLISIPPPVLVVHLKRFQQLNPSSSSPLSSFAERLASGFSAHQSSSRASRDAASGGGFVGYGGIGRSGIRKLEEFVSFPECLDLSPFLEPVREEDTVSSDKESRSCRRNGVRDEDGRCLYRLYAVVVHIGDMLSGHYVSYVALPDKPPLMDVHGDRGVNGFKVNSAEEKTLEEKGGSDESADLKNEKRSSSAGEKTTTRTTRQWAYISDTNVRVASLDEVLNARAYICKYERI